MNRLLPCLEQVMRGTDDDGQPFDPPVIPAPTRAEAGRVLADLSWLPDDLDATVDVPAGEFLMGSTSGEIEWLKAQVKTTIDSGELEIEDREPSELYDAFCQVLDREGPQCRVHVPTFHMSKYPVTNAQFRRFIEGGGYENEAYWSPEGLAWLRRTAEEEKDLPDYRQRAGRAEPGYWRDARFNRPNAPVVGVTWYEAEAYCRWLSITEGRDYGLPTEAMWEKAARGGLEIPFGTPGDVSLGDNPNPQRRYPWGDDWNPERANTGEDDIRQPTAAGVYPLGASPYGAQDMIGNIWEWCADPFGPYRDPHEPPQTGDFRLLRGGAWHHSQWRTRCAYRGRNSPDYWHSNVGFRVAEYL
jgi:formylglycine-generating enzyme required for sulfatase activity